MAWTAPRSWVAGEIVTAAIMNTHVRDDLIAAGEASWLVDIDTFPAAAANTNWDVVIPAASVVYGGYKQSSGAQNDEISWDVVLAVGTYTLTVVHYKDANVGIYTCTLDATSLGTIDGYNAAPSANARSTITGIAVATTQKYTFKLKMATKNASSSSFFGLVQHAQWRRTA